MKYKGTLIVVKDCKKALDFYRELFGFREKEIISGRMPGNEQFRVKVYGMYRDVQG